MVLERSLHSHVAALGLVILGVLGACGPSSNRIQNEPPSLTLDVGSQLEYVAGEDRVQIEATATDPDGDRLSFRVDNKPERASLQKTSPQKAVFAWEPIPSDVTDGEPLRLTFVVEDRHGAIADEVVRMSIRAGNAVPEFENSASKLYDVTSDKPLSFQVEVRDDDSRQVTIEMPSARAPTGATFEQTSEKKGQFRWDPSPKQEQSRVHSVVFVADDGQTDPVRQKVTIIFKDGEQNSGTGVPAPGEGCDETRPIQFDPLGAQHTSKDYPIAATFSSAAAKKYDRASVLWTTKDPFNDPDVDFNAEDLSIDGTEITGSIPNLGLSSGTTETVFYAVCAVDDDAPQSAEEKITCSPESVFHGFIAYPPNQSGCADDGASNGSTSSASTISKTKWKHYRACKGSKDVHSFEVESDQKVTVFVTFPHGQTINMNVVDASMQTHNDALSYSKCAGIGAVQIEHGASDSKKTYYIEVNGEDIPYQTTLVREGGSSGACKEDGEEPNDSVAEATDASGNPKLTSMSVCKMGDVDVFSVDLLEGDVFGANVAFTHADGNVDATLFAPSQSGMVGPATAGVAKSWSKDDGEQIAHTVKESGTYYFVVFARSATNSYAVDFDSTCRSNDAYSNNHSRRTAALPQTKTYNDLRLCGGQADWYERTVFDGQELSATVRVEEGGTVGDVTVEMFDENGNKVESGQVSNGAVEIDYFGQISPKAQYFVRVASPNDLLYSMEIRQN